MGRRSRWLLVGSIATLVVALVALVLVRGDDGEPPASATSSTSVTSSTSSTSTHRSTPSSTEPSSTTPSSTEPSSTTPSSTEPSSTAPSATTQPSTSSPSSVPPWSGVATVVGQGPASRPVVALTFDAGSDLGYAGAILDTLAANGIRASFGLTGKWTVEHPEVVARMAREGHQLVNHTWSHPSFTGYSTGTAPLPTSERLAQLTRAEAAIVDAAGVAAEPWFRPPYGDYDQSVLVDVGSAGYRYVAGWTVDSLGWKGLTAAEVTARCLDRAEPGAIYLFHVGSASADHAALGAIIDGLRARGYGFATVAALIGA